MKTSSAFTKTLRLKSIALAFMALSILTLSSCLKDEGNSQQVIQSALKVINGAPDAPAFDFVISRQLVPTLGIPYTKGTRYFALASNGYNASFYEYDTNTTPLYETRITLEQGKFHTLFLAGTQADSLTSLLIEDDLKLPTAENAKVRFLNLSPDAGPLDFALVSDSLFSSQKAFKGYTDFHEMPAGEYQARFKSSTGTSINHEFTLKLTAGKIYTVWARGLRESTDEDQAFDDGLIIHDL